MPDADVVIMGGGLAGLVAGNRALELGLNAIILERGTSEDYLSDSRVSTGAIHLASSSPKTEPETIVSRIVERTSGFADRTLAAAFARTGSRAIDWLAVNGAEFLQTTPTPRYWLAPSRGRQHGLSWQGWGPDLTLKRLIGRFRERGGQLLLGAAGRELLFDGGSCIGIRADTVAGPIDCGARVVMLADGGFQANRELLGRFITPAPEKIKLRNTGTAIGTGVQLAEAAGAELVGMKYFYGHLLSRNALENDALWPYPTLDLIASASMVVGTNGRRLANEGHGGIYLANQIAWQEDPLDYWLVFDDEVWSRGIAMRAGDPTNPDSPNPDLVELGGTLLQADTIEALAAAAGIAATPLQTTIDGFNGAVDAGDLSALEPLRTQGPTEAKPIRAAPFYAAPLCVGLTFTMGGPRIDEFCRPLREDGAPIPGLFVIGSLLGGLEGGETLGYWGGLSQALISGLRASEFVAGRMEEL